MTVRTNILFTFLIVVYVNAYSQGSSQLEKYEDSLSAYSENFLNIQYEEAKKETDLKDFKRILNSALNIPDGVNYPFTKIKSISIQTSSDKSFRVFTWFTLNKNGYSPHGLISYKKPGKKTPVIYELNAIKEIPKNISFKTLNQDNWLGAVYYEIIEFKQKNKKYYALIGFDGNNGITHKKIIDILSFTSNGQPRFGAPVFINEKRIANRIIFEYSAKAKISLSYHEKNKMIIFDHLAPERPELEGMFQYYVPDLSYDAYKLESGKWNYKPDVDARNMDENKGKEGEKYNLKLPGAE